MAECIERDAAINELDEWLLMYPESDAAREALSLAKRSIKKLPAADVRPVVLCRDCKWCHAGYCEKYDDIIPFGCANKPWEDWFCADGEKREESHADTAN